MVQSPDLAALSAAVAQAPDDPVARARFVRAAVEQGTEPEVHEACAVAAGLWLEGDGALVAGALQRAWERLAASRTSADADALDALARAWESGDEQTVVSVGTRLLAQPCFAREAHVRTALALVARGHAEEGALVLERYVGARPDDPRGWENLVAARAVVHRATGGREALAAAVATARAAVEMHPADAAVLLNASEVLRDAGRFDEALRHAREATTRAPGDGRAADAVAALVPLQADLPSDGTDPDADFEVGAARLDAGDARGALPFLRAAFEHGAAHASAGTTLARALLALGAARDAALVLDRHLGRAPDDAEAWGLLGVSRLAMSGDPPAQLLVRRARLDLERAIGRAPDVAEWHVALARCLVLEGNEPGARASLERGAALGSDEAKRSLGFAGRD